MRKNSVALVRRDDLHVRTAEPLRPAHSRLRHGLRNSSAIPGPSGVRIRARCAAWLFRSTRLRPAVDRDRLRHRRPRLGEGPGPSDSADRPGAARVPIAV